jgi:hypothetical protein
LLELFVLLLERFKIKFYICPAMSILFEIILMYTNNIMVQHGMEETPCIKDEGLDERRVMETPLGLADPVRI